MISYICISYLILKKFRGARLFYTGQILLQITDCRISRLRLYMLRVIKATRTKFFKRQRRVVKRMMTEGQGRIRKVEMLKRDIK